MKIIQTFQIPKGSQSPQESRWSELPATAPWTALWGKQEKNVVQRQAATEGNPCTLKDKFRKHVGGRVIHRTRVKAICQLSFTSTACAASTQKAVVLIFFKKNLVYCWLSKIKSPWDDAPQFMKQAFLLHCLAI